VRLSRAEASSETLIRSQDEVLRNAGRVHAAPSRRALAGGCQALTRTDFLVALTVLSLLGLVLTACVVSTRRQARLKVCIANVGQVSRAILLYGENNGKRLPGPVPGELGDAWWWYKEQVKGYLGLAAPSSPNDRVFACPSDRGYSEARPFHDSPRFDYGSYVFNGVTLPGVPSISGSPLVAIKQPVRTLLAMEWTAHAPLSWHRSRTGKENAPFYCDAESVVGFVDGHVNFTKIYYDGYNAAYTREPIAGYEYQYGGN
jgi:hypothetical protein